MLEDFKGKSVFDLNAERERELKKHRPTYVTEQERNKLKEEVRRLIAFTPPQRNRDGKYLTAKRATGYGPIAIRRDGYTIHKFAFETEPGVIVPALSFEPAQKPAKSLPWVLYLHGEGKAADAGPKGPIERLVLAGHRVLALDLRGLGETAPGRAAANRPNYLGTDSKEAFLSLHLNRPLLGQRIQDVALILLRIAEESPDGEPIQWHVVGIARQVRSHCTPPSLRL